ncbi:hypothetical protein Dxin01_03584 [Deinococcus xinjiangensis]|uniref:Uncharacterized protein n=1 Tax=Deinococcus xinjiangensis TaxID=457454 RepID=A0ABP9VF05_9DEIO
MKLRIFLHAYIDRKLQANIPFEMLTAPRIGEYIKVEGNGNWYRINGIVHCPFNNDNDYQPHIEVYADQVEEMSALRSIHREDEIIGF